MLAYLSSPEDGGATSFPQLQGISVAPKCGRVLVWNNLDSQGRCDRRTVHEAQPVQGAVPKRIVQRWCACLLVCLLLQLQLLLAAVARAAAAAKQPTNRPINASH